jgi:hypothetical protein
MEPLADQGADTIRLRGKELSLRPRLKSHPLRHTLREIARRFRDFAVAACFMATRKGTATLAIYPPSFGDDQAETMAT